MKNLERIETIKNLIANRENDKAILKANYDEAILDIDNSIRELKLELADIILSDKSDSEKAEDLVTFVSVKFNNKGKVYDYLWDSSNTVSAGDNVEVESQWHGFQTAEVVRVFKEVPQYRDHNYKSARPLSA